MTKVSERVATRQSGDHLKTTRCVNGALVEEESSLFRERIKLMRQRQRLDQQHCWQPDLRTGNSSIKKSYKYKNSTHELVVTTLGISSACSNCWHRANLRSQPASGSHWSSLPKKKASSYLCYLMSLSILYFILLLHLTDQLKPQLLEAAKYRRNIPPNIGYNDDATTTMEASKKAQPFPSTTFHQPSPSPNNNNNYHNHHHHHYHHQQNSSSSSNNNTSPQTKTSIERSRFQKQHQQSSSLLSAETDLNVSTLANNLSNVTTGESDFS